MTYCSLDAAFLASISEEHAFWDELGSHCTYPSKASFEDSHCAFLKVTTRATCLGRDGLAVITVDEGPLADCGICSSAGDGKLACE